MYAKQASATVNLWYRNKLLFNCFSAPTALHDRLTKELQTVDSCIEVVTAEMSALSCALQQQKKNVSGIRDLYIRRTELMIVMFESSASGQ